MKCTAIALSCCIVVFSYTYSHPGNLAIPGTREYSEQLPADDLTPAEQITIEKNITMNVLHWIILYTFVVSLFMIDFSDDVFGPILDLRNEVSFDYIKKAFEHGDLPVPDRPTSVA